MVGEDLASARRVGRGVAIVAPGGVTLCDADIALIVLAEAVTIVKPLPVRARGPAAGDRIRAVGFGRPGEGDPGGKKLLREHVLVGAGKFADLMASLGRLRTVEPLKPAHAKRTSARR